MRSPDEMLNTLNKTEEETAEPQRKVKERNRPRSENPKRAMGKATESRKRKGLTSMWDKVSAYGKRASKKTSEAARKVQARSARIDTQKAADRAERAAGLVTSTLAGLVKTAVAGTLGVTKGVLTGTAKAGRPSFVTQLHAQNDLAVVGHWPGEVERYQDRKGIPYDEAPITVTHDGAHQLIGGKNVLQLDDAAVTRMPIEGETRQVIAVPLFEDGTSTPMGCVVLEYDDRGEDRVFLNLWER